MSKLTFKTQAKHTALGLLGVAAPAIILSTYHGISAVAISIACVATAAFVGGFEGYGFGKHHYDDLISTQSAMIDRLQMDNGAHRATVADYKSMNYDLRKKVAELERPRGWVITKHAKDNRGTLTIVNVHYLTMQSPGWIYSFVRDRAGVLPKDLVVFSSQELAFEFLDSKRESFTYFADALVERVS